MSDRADREGQKKGCRAVRLWKSSSFPERSNGGKTLDPGEGTIEMRHLKEKTM